jgi:transposase
MARKKKEKEKTLKREQIRLLLHFQWLQGITAGDARRAINNAYGSNTVGSSTVYDWYARFGKDGMQLKDKEHTGRPQRIDREEVIRAIEADPTKTSRMLAGDFDCSHTAIEKILHEAGKFGSLDLYYICLLGFKWRKTRLVPYQLTDAQKQKRIDAATELLERQNETPFLEDVITMDETWLPYNNPDPHNAWLQPNQRAPATPKPDFRQRKIMMSVFWNSAGVIYW